MIINDVMTFAEACTRWGLSDSTLRMAAKRGQLNESEYRKSGKTWLITKDAMNRIYGDEIIMKNGVYDINKEVLEGIEQCYRFDFPVDFKKFNRVTVSLNTLEFYKEETGKQEYTEDGDIEYNVVPEETILYKRNDVSGVYCRVY